MKHHFNCHSDPDPYEGEESLSLSKKGFCILISFLLFPITIFAATVSPSATPTTNDATGRLKQIEDLKDRLATKVAQLRQTQKKAVFGTVKSTSVSTVTIETTTKDIKIELTDNLKVVQYIRGKRTTLIIDDIAKGDVVSVFGEYDVTLDILKAKLIFIQNKFPTRVLGTVSNSNATTFTLTIQTPEGQEYMIDIEKSTVTNIWIVEKGLTKSGFSKIAVGDLIQVVGTSVPKKDNRLSATRILDLGNLSGITPTPSPSLTPTPAPTQKLKPTVVPTL